MPVSGDGRRRSTAAGILIAIDVIDEACGTGGERDDGIKLVLGEQGVDAFLVRGARNRRGL